MIKSNTTISDTGDIEKEIVAEISIPQAAARNSVTDAGVTVKITLNLDYITSGTQYKLKTINEQILKIAQSYPTIFRTSSKDIPFRIF